MSGSSSGSENGSGTSSRRSSSSRRRDRSSGSRVTAGTPSTSAAGSTLEPVASENLARSPVCKTWVPLPRVDSSLRPTVASGYFLGLLDVIKFLTASRNSDCRASE